jgi:hypothetical protein
MSRRDLAPEVDDLQMQSRLKRARPRWSASFFSLVDPERHEESQVTNEL